MSQEVMAARTSGEAKAKLLWQMQANRNRCVVQIMERKSEGLSEVELVVHSYTEGWDDGYKAGFQEALTCLQEALADTIKGQREGIMATP